MIKAVIFDLDGTLLDRDASLALFIGDQYERLKEQLGHIPKLQFTERFIELDARGYRWKDEVYQQLISEFGIEGISWEILLADYVNSFQNFCVPFPGLLEMLEELKSRSIRLGLITNGQGDLQLGSIRSLGIEPYFDVSLVSEIEGISKPDPRIFQKALKALDVRPEEAVYVGDHPRNDVEAADAVGMITVWKKDPHFETAAADYIIENLNELPHLWKEVEIKIGAFHPDQTEELIDLFYETIHTVNAADYSAVQLEAWAPAALRSEKAKQWRTSLSQNATFIAKDGERIIGFCDLADEGYLNRLYVHKDYQRQGIASRLLNHAERKAEKQGHSEIRTEASITAKPLFLQRGYGVIQEQAVERQGVRLENFLMAKRLNP